MGENWPNKNQDGSPGKSSCFLLILKFDWLWYFRYSGFFMSQPSFVSKIIDIWTLLKIHTNLEKLDQSSFFFFDWIREKLIQNLFLWHLKRSIDVKVCQKVPPSIMIPFTAFQKSFWKDQENFSSIDQILPSYIDWPSKHLTKNQRQTYLLYLSNEPKLNETVLRGQYIFGDMESPVQKRCGYCWFQYLVKFTLIKTLNHDWVSYYFC